MPLAAPFVMPGFSDHFSPIAASYADYRPHYPAALFAWLAGLAPDRERAWDCGTGSGQAATALAEHFNEVIGTDPSVAQLENASPAAGLSYAAMMAEETALATRSVALVTVAQALHWFRPADFFREAHRVLRPAGIVAVWSYALIEIDPDVDRILGRFYRDTVGQYWPTERALVDSGYRDIDLPYPELAHPPFEMDAAWDLSQLGGYVTTWSAVSRYRAARHEDPVPPLLRSIAGPWGPATERRRVRWPLTLRVARKR